MTNEQKLGLLEWLSRSVASSGASTAANDVYLKEFDEMFKPFLSPSGNENSKTSATPSDTITKIFRLSDFTTGNGKMILTHNLGVGFYSRVDLISNGMNGEDVRTPLYKLAVTDNAGFVNYLENSLEFGGWRPPVGTQENFAFLIEFCKKEVAKVLPMEKSRE